MLIIAVQIHESSAVLGAIFILRESQYKVKSS